MSIRTTLQRPNNMEAFGASSKNSFDLDPTSYSLLPPTYKLDVCRTSSSLPKDQSQSKTARQEKLFIGGISLNVSLSELEKALAQAAVCQSDISISMARRTQKNNYPGYGYITTENAADKNRLLELKTFQFKDSWIGIKPFLNKKNEIRQLKHDKDNRKIHIKGINFRITETDLDNYFSRFGGINHIQINKSLTTGSYKGFAFIEFASSDSVTQITKTPVHCVRGVNLVCEKSKAKNGGSARPGPAPVVSLPQSPSLNPSGGSSVHQSFRLLDPRELNQVVLNHSNQNIRFNLPASK